MFQLIDLLRLFDKDKTAAVHNYVWYAILHTYFHLNR